MVCFAVNALRSQGKAASAKEADALFQAALHADPAAKVACDVHLEIVASFTGATAPEYLDCRGFKRHFFEGCFPRSAFVLGLDMGPRLVAVFEAWWELSRLRAQVLGLALDEPVTATCFMCGEALGPGARGFGRISYCCEECVKFDADRREKYAQILL
jgi:hypothetical protein